MISKTTKLSLSLAVGLISQEVLAADPSGVSSGVGFLQISGALLFVLVLMFAAAWLLKRVGPTVTGNKVPVKVVGGVSVGNRERVLVVEVDDQWLVLGVTPTHISNLASMPKKDIPSEPNQTNHGPFQDWLKRTVEKRNDAPVDHK